MSTLPIFTIPTVTKAKILKFKNKSHRPKRKPHLPSVPLLGEDIQRAKSYFLNKPDRYGTNLRDYTMFVFNINVALRCGDLTKLKIKDIYQNNTIVDHVVIIEQKTNKVREFTIRPDLKPILMNYLVSLGDFQPEWYLFHPSRPICNPYKQWSVRSINDLLYKMQNELNLKNISSHTMRKTGARAKFDAAEARGDQHAMQDVVDMLGHTSERVSRKYLGHQREHVQNIYLSGDLI